MRVEGLSDAMNLGCSALGVAHCHSSSVPSQSSAVFGLPRATIHPTASPPLCARYCGAHSNNLDDAWMLNPAG